MGNNILEDLIKQSAQFKDLKKDLENGNIPDISGMFEMITKLPNMLDDSVSKLSKAEQKKLAPMLNKLKKEASLENIFSKINADKTK